MENRQIAKPPWVIAASQWQYRHKTPQWPSMMIFREWGESSRTALQKAKERISALEEQRRWELVKKMVNPYEIVYTHEDKQFHPSLALIKPLSRSYFKLIEMLDVLQFFETLPKQQAKIRTAHVAEGPGGFIQAVVDVCERNKKILQLATAMTLKPTDQRVPGWRRASAFLHHHQQVRLHYGVDGTGDVYQLGNQDSFIEAVAPGVHLFTADGGFDFSVDYDIQEHRVFHLLVCSATIGLRSLLTDGSFVLKLFDVFAAPTQLLVLLIARCFKEWQLYKPALSRPCNSERYFLGRGFKGLPAGVLQSLLQIQKESLRDLYPIDISGVALEAEQDYLNRHIKANTEEQLVAIEQAEIYAVQPEKWYGEQLSVDFDTSLRWCQRFRVPYTTTKPAQLVVPNPFPLVVPITSAPRPCECTSEQVAVPQSPSPGDGSGCPVPYVPTLPTLSVD
jgi:23S rRNA U2552 (ribose-2'-O)-methylase RlmE/FtsJ